MRRFSARTVVVVPWLLLTVAFFSANLIGWVPAAAFALAALLLVLAGAGEFTKSLRSIRHDLLAGNADFENRFFIKELHDIAVAAATVNRELSGRASLASNTEQQLNAVLDSITEGILQVTSATRFVRANQAARAMLNLPRGIEGQTAKALIRHPDLRLCIERAAAGVSFEPVEITLDDRHLLVSPRPFRSSALSDQAGAVIAIVDFTEYRRLESVRRDFVANVSHELKTPLTSIRGYAETLISDELSRDVQLQFLEVVNKNANRIQRIVDDLLDLSRLQSGGWQPELQQVDPVAIAEEVWTTCEGAKRKDIAFSVQTQCDLDVLADPGGLRQILSNLFDNAIRYTPAGGSVNVLITPHRENGNGSDDPKFLDLEVIDNGTGIPRESLPRIFERFYRVDPARSRADGGTGLGLSIVKHLAESMSGEVSAESELGKGTTIRVTLPAAPEH